MNFLCYKFKFKYVILYLIYYLVIIETKNINSIFTIIRSFKLLLISKLIRELSYTRVIIYVISNCY